MRLVVGTTALLTLAFLVRIADFPNVFVGDGDVVFTIGDPYYHLRLALVPLHDFPSLLRFDPYINFPEGSHVPIPPIWPLLLGGAGRLLGGDRAALEHAAAWLPPLLGALTLLPVVATGRRVGGIALGLGAAALLALLPVHILYTAIGNADHHAVEGLLGALLLWLYVRALATEDGEATSLRLHVALTATRIAMVLTWSGSLLHLGIGEAALLLAAATRRSHRRMRLAGLGCLATAGALLPFALGEVAHGGPAFSTVELSLLHPLYFLVLSGIALTTSALESARPSATTLGQLARMALLAAVLGGSLLAIPALRDAVAGSEPMLTKGNVWHARVAEQQALFAWSPVVSAERGIETYGLLCFLIPLAPLAALRRARDRRIRPVALFLAAWSAILGLLALSQVRFGVDYAPAGAIVLALLIADLAHGAARVLAAGARTGRALAVALGALLVWPGVAAGPLSSLVATREWLAAPDTGDDRALATAAGSLVRFARDVRAATPETGGFLGDAPLPEYGILVFPGIGHTFLYEARRATPGGNLGPYAGAANFESARTFYGLTDEGEALAVAAQLRTRYVATNLVASEGRETLLHRLHVEDGNAAEGQPRFEHFRLVTEGPAGGLPLAVAMGRSDVPTPIPYKLFEIVAGADLHVETDAGERVTASVELRTPTGRRFRYVAEAEAGPEGAARLRLPYATRTRVPTRPTTAWRIQAGDRVAALSVSDADVQEGRRVFVDLRAQKP